MIEFSLSEKVMVGTGLLGGMAGVVGTFAVLRGRALIGDMLAHAALPGVCLAFLVTGSRGILGLSLGALISGLAGIGILTMLVRWTRTKEDAALGIVLSTFLVLLSVIQKPSIGGNKAGLNSYIFGEPGNMLTSDLYVLAVVAVVVFLLVTLMFKELKLVCFDTEFAASQGWPTWGIDFTIMAVLAVVTIVGLPIVGIILMAAMIILPAASARFWTQRLHRMLLLACGMGALAAVGGTYVGRGYPAGASIVLAASTLFVLSMLLAPQRGLIAKLVTEFRLRRRVQSEHLLRALYELSEPQLPEIPSLKFSTLKNHRYWGSLESLLHRASESQLVEWSDDSVKLSPLGLRRAAQLTKAHRLWELYLMQHADIAPDHVDRDADDVEHLLPESVLAKLEQQLADEGRLPAPIAEVPHSPHDLHTESERNSQD